MTLPVSATRISTKQIYLTDSYVSFSSHLFLNSEIEEISFTFVHASYEANKGCLTCNLLNKYINASLSSCYHIQPYLLPVDRAAKNRVPPSRLEIGYLVDQISSIQSKPFSTSREEDKSVSSK